MTTSRHTIVVVNQSAEPLFGLPRAAELSGMHPDMIIEFMRAGVIHQAAEDQGGSPCFDETMVGRLRQIEHLRADENLSLRMICHIVRMLDRLESAERELRTLRERWR